jgi:coproporphyrinogen III oxidase
MKMSHNTTIEIDIEKIDVAQVMPAIKQYLLGLQDRICCFIESEEEGVCFDEEKWQHKEGGGGITRVLTAGQVIEKAGVNFSHIHGLQLPPAAVARRSNLINATFQAIGVSVVVHPYNPFIPTTHMNVRFIVVEKFQQVSYWWFGGGFDLTPYYGFAEDCQYWHQMAKAACDPFGADVYYRYKKWCDDYFYLKHREEPRGIGGLFFDDLHEWGFARCFAFMRSIGDHYIKA